MPKPSTKVEESLWSASIVSCLPLSWLIITTSLSATPAATFVILRLVASLPTETVFASVVVEPKPKATEPSPEALEPRPKAVAFFADSALAPTDTESLAVLVCQPKAIAPSPEADACNPIATAFDALSETVAARPIAVEATPKACAFTPTAVALVFVACASSPTAVVSVAEAFAERPIAVALSPSAPAAFPNAVAPSLVAYAFTPTAVASFASSVEPALVTLAAFPEPVILIFVLSTGSAAFAGVAVATAPKANNPRLISRHFFKTLRYCAVKSPIAVLEYFINFSFL